MGLKVLRETEKRDTEPAKEGVYTYHLIRAAATGGGESVLGNISQEQGDSRALERQQI